mgnify:CR=1 FL=1
MRILESSEDYLEAMLMMQERFGYIRSIDIARELNYSKPSVSRAIGLLKKDEYIIVDSKGYIELTDKGAEVANTIYDRHDTLSSFFESIGVCHDTAVNDACRIEHVISTETMNKIKEHMKQK